MKSRKGDVSNGLSISISTKTRVIRPSGLGQVKRQKHTRYKSKKISPKIQHKTVNKVTKK